MSVAWLKGLGSIGFRGLGFRRVVRWIAPTCGSRIGLGNITIRVDAFMLEITKMCTGMNLSSED